MVSGLANDAASNDCSQILETAHRTSPSDIEMIVGE